MKMKAVSIYSSNVDEALEAVAWQNPEKYEGIFICFEDFDRENQLEILVMLAEELIKKNKMFDYRCFLSSADDDGELVDCLIPLLKNRNNPKAVEAFLDMVEAKLIDYHAYDLNQRLEYIQESFADKIEYEDKYGFAESDDAA